MIWITGDKHGAFDAIENFCLSHPECTQERDTLILLGDVGLNYYCDFRDIALKQHVAQLPLTFLCVHGNHEQRVESMPTYQQQEAYGGIVYVDPAYPNQRFLQDGTIYTIAEKKVLVIGGAYSTDKFHRLEHRWPWFEDEQPTPEIRARTEAMLEAHQWQVDIVLSHTCPRSRLPKTLTSDHKIDYSTEDWLETIAQRLTFQQWYAGHFHCDKTNENVHFLYHTIRPFLDV